MTTGLILAIAGISGGARAILLAGYFFISLKVQELRASERSIQGIVKKEGYRAGDVMRILRPFSSSESARATAQPCRQKLRKCAGDLYEDQKRRRYQCATEYEMYSSGPYYDY